MFCMTPRLTSREQCVLGAWTDLAVPGTFHEPLPCHFQIISRSVASKVQQVHLLAQVSVHQSCSSHQDGCYDQGTL